MSELDFDWESILQQYQAGTAPDLIAQYGGAGGDAVLGGWGEDS
jgi:hypothetical protein